MNAGRNDRAAAVVTPGVARALFSRLRAAFRVLRAGGGVDQPEVAVSRARVDLLVDQALAVVGLPSGWAAAATSAELELLANTAQVAVDARRRDWADVEVGAWPC